MRDRLTIDGNLVLAILLVALVLLGMGICGGLERGTIPM